MADLRNNALYVRRRRAQRRRRAAWRSPRPAFGLVWLV